MEPPALRCGESIRQEARAARCRRIGQARRRGGRPPQDNPKGPPLLPHGSVERLGRVPDTAFALLLPLRQKQSAQVIPCESNLLLTGLAKVKTASRPNSAIVVVDLASRPDWSRTCRNDLNLRRATPEEEIVNLFARVTSCSFVAVAAMALFTPATQAQIFPSSDNFGKLPDPAAQTCADSSRASAERVETCGKLIEELRQVHGQGHRMGLRQPLYRQCGAKEL